MIKKVYEVNVTQRDNERHQKFEKEFEAVVNKLVRATGGKYKEWIKKVLDEICANRFRDGMDTSKDLYDDEEEE